MNANQARLKELRSRVEDLGLYIIKWSEKKEKWELLRKLAGTDRTLFMASNEYKTVLMVTANTLMRGQS